MKPLKSESAPAAPVAVVSETVAAAFGMVGMPNVAIVPDAAPSAPAGGHTPGPWKAVEAAYNPPGWLWVQNGPGALLADVHQNPNIPLDARNANARLMAAAPDLLAALADVVDVAEYFGKSESHKAACYGGLLGVLPKIRAAIAKAKGE